MYQVEIAKNNGNFFFTGEIRYDKEFIYINTIKGETLKFRKEQVQQVLKIKR